jgi:hypothetical protein
LKIAFHVIWLADVGWALLIFGGIIGGLPKLGFPNPSPYWEKTGTYLMALSLLVFALSYLLRRFEHAFLTR